MKPNVTSFFDTATNTISYVVADPNGNSCAIIDSVLDFDFSSGRTNTAFAEEIIAFINEKGRVSETTILKGLTSELNDSAMEAIRKTRFRPAKQKGKKVGAWISVPVNFKLK